MSTSPISRQRPSVQAGGIRRSFTQPPRSLSFHEKAGLDPSDSAADILYSHPGARIVSFNPPTDAITSASSPTSIDLDYPVDTIETLPWKSSSEDVIASGSLIIEKIRGSTNFLKSGTKPLHALMRNSQCWCVDGEATLVMRVGKLKYYRIELPYSTEEDKAKVQQLKDVLTRILRFETTPCPFKRGFHVDLPESATTPRRKGPWKRRLGSLQSSPSSATPSPLSLRKSRARLNSATMEVQLESRSSDAESKDEKEDGLSNEDDLEDTGTEAQSELVVGDEEEDDDDDDDDDDDGLAVSQSSLQEDDLTPNTSPIAMTSGRSTPAPVFRANGDSSDSSGDEVVASIDSSTDASLLSERLEPDTSTPAVLDSKDADGTERESRDGPRDDIDQQAEKIVNSSSSKEDPAITLDQAVDSSATFQRHLDGGKAEREPEYIESTDISNDPALRGLLANGEAAEAVEHDETSSSSEDLSADTEENVDLAPPSGGLAIDKTSNKSYIDGVEENDPAAILSQTLSNSSDAVSISSYADSFHSLASLENESPDIEADPAEFSDPTPLAESNDPLSPPQRHHRRGLSEMTVTTKTDSTLRHSLPVSPLRPSTAISEGPSTPSLLRSSASDSSWPEIETPVAISGDDGLRRRAKGQRSFSPLTPSSELFESPRRPPRANHLTGAILQTARHIAMIRPMDVVFMLAHIVARIASGATAKDLMNGDLFRRPVEPITQPRRRRSLPHGAEGQKVDVVEEDDYGVPIRGRSRGAALIVRKDDDADSLFDLD